MSDREITTMKCGCIIEVINNKHMITQYCSEHEESDDMDIIEDPKFHKIRKFNERDSI